MSPQTSRTWARALGYKAVPRVYSSAKRAGLDLQAVVEHSINVMVDDERDGLGTTKERAKLVARTLRRQARRPFVLEITGTPKAGKTTLIAMVESFLRDCGWKVHVLKERAGECPLPMKGHFFFNTWTMGTMLAGLLDAVDREHDLVILDRGIFDSLIWLEMQKDQGQVSSDEHDAFVRFVMLERWRGLVDAVALIRIDAETAMKRENTGRLIPRTGSVMNESRLRFFNDALARLESQYSTLFHFEKLVNSGDAKTGALTLIDALLKSALAFSDPKIAVFTRADAEMLMPRSCLSWRPELWNDLVSRAEVEDDDGWVQLLACGAQVHAGEVFLIVRRPRRDDLVLPRDNSAMLWRGCHISKPGDELLELRHLQQQLMSRLRSDLHLGHLDAHPTPLGLVWEREGCERRHLGLMFRVEIPRNIAEFLDEKQFKTNGRGYSLHSSFARPEDLADDTTGDRGYTLEEWSRVLLEESWLP
jgi:predicted ATPase